VLNTSAFDTQTNLLRKKNPQSSKGYLKSYGDKIPPIQKRMGGYFHDNDVLV
jgi:hypothetical protein